MRDGAGRRLVPLGVLAAMGAAYVAARPALAATVPHLDIVEFPVTLVVAAPLLWLAARPARPPRRLEAPWKRHEQVVRVLDDPETAPLETDLRAWVERGASPDRARAIFSRVDPTLGEMTTKASTRRKREALLRAIIQRSPSQDGA